MNMKNNPLALEQEILKETKGFVKELLESDSSGHDYEHIFRVTNQALTLANKYPCDKFVVEMAALLHDIDDPKLNPEPTHKVETYLNQIELSRERIEKILSITHNLSFTKSKKGIIVDSIEGKIVQDADRLDAIGAIGIARCFAYGGANSRPIYKGSTDDESSIAHFYQKLLKLKDMMNLEESRNIAIERTALMNDYLHAFFEELK